MKILTMCGQGLVRSVALADVLKLHFRPADVLPAGCAGNTRETQLMLFAWADRIVVMHGPILRHVPDEHRAKTLVCDVGPDVGNTHGSKTRKLIDQCWDWARKNAVALGVEEHQERL